MNLLEISESQELRQCEETIKQGLKSFIEVGEALLVIRDKRLYRQEFDTFEDYCLERWGISRPRAYELLNASEVAQNLSAMADIRGPENERQMRPLVKLEPEQQREAWQRAVETAPDGKVTAKHVEMTVREMIEPEDEEPSSVVFDLTDSLMEEDEPTPIVLAPEIVAPVRNVLHSSASNEWYTPARYIEAVREVLGEIDIDPASNETANNVIKAKQYFDITTNGFDKPWNGRVFLNPPYGREEGDSNQERWSQRLLQQYRDGITEEAILLVNATTDRSWFAPLWDYLICFTNHRIKFYTTEGDPSQPTHGNVFVYLGSNVDRFAQVFSQFGVIASRWGG